jgi:hypothetical protein
MAQTNPRADINAAIAKATQRLMNQLDRRFTEEISAVKWPWPTEPELRDIVDSGRLRASQTREETPQGTRFTWPVEYASEVHNGGVSVRTRQPFPGRPWTKAPLEEVPQAFGQLLEAEMKKIS